MLPPHGIAKPPWTKCYSIAIDMGTTMSSLATPCHHRHPKTLPPELYCHGLLIIICHEPSFCGAASSFHLGPLLKLLTPCCLHYPKTHHIYKLHYPHLYLPYARPLYPFFVLTGCIDRLHQCGPHQVAIAELHPHTILPLP